MSRSDWNGTSPPQPQLTANELWLQDLAFTRTTADDSVEMPTLGAKNGLTLASMIGKDYDDPEWETLLDQLTFDEMVNPISLGFHNTAWCERRQARHQGRERPQGLTASL